MTDFHQAIAKALATSWWEISGGGSNGYEPGPPNSGDSQLAWSVLQSPEMQAIRRTLAVYGNVEGALVGMEPTRWLRGVCNLPESVIAWVIGEEQ